MVGAVSLQTAPSAFAAPCERILFSAPGESARAALFHARADGSRRIRLTPYGPRGAIARYEWSPDGRRIAYLEEQGDRLGLGVMRYDGNHKRTLVDGVSFFDWAPGGRRLVYTTDEDITGATTMHVVVVRSGAQSTVATGRDPSWSPRGGLLAFSGMASDLADRTSDIFVVRPDGSGLRRVTSDAESDDRRPAWSPEGSLAFERYPLDQASDPDYGGPYADVWRVDVDGSDPTQLTHVQTDQLGAFAPAWSPTGARIAFERWASEGGNVVIIDADGSNAADIARPFDRAYSPSWSPSGRRLAFTSYDDQSGPSVWTVRSDGTGYRKMVGDGENPAWGSCRR